MSIVSYVRESFSELKEHVSWTPANELSKLTVVVLIFSIIFALLIWVSDTILSKIIKILPHGRNVLELIPKKCEKIKKSGLAKGGSLENAVVVDEEKVINEEGLRNEKEFVNHKILDLAGDFLLSGYRILGKVDCYQGGHQLSNMLLRKLMKSKSSFTTIELNNIELHKKSQSNQSIKLAVNA